MYTFKIRARLSIHGTKNVEYITPLRKSGFWVKFLKLGGHLRKVHRGKLIQFFGMCKLNMEPHSSRTSGLSGAVGAYKFIRLSTQEQPSN